MWEILHLFLYTLSFLLKSRINYCSKATCSRDEVRLVYGHHEAQLEFFVENFWFKLSLLPSFTSDHEGENGLL